MSNFCDQTVVEFQAGKGGDGSVHFRREKYISRGGPDGGDGGIGGSIILLTDENINTLSDFNAQKHFTAGEGKNGAKKNMSGKSGEDLIMKVPAGTILYDDKTQELIVDLKHHNQQFVIVKGGRGGMGNYHFKSSIHQAPQFAEQGEEGEKRTVRMELQLVADIGIIGFPSAGKSTLISRISNARPKIADYPFTTLIPNLGVVDMRVFDRHSKDSFVVADIPGLIEGAHLGKGLGHQFLRHVSRTEILVHLIDPTRNDIEDYAVINKELAEYSQRLSLKSQIVAISKIDAMDETNLKKFKKSLEKRYPELKGNIRLLSSVTGTGIKELVYELHKHVQELRKKKTEENMREPEITEKEKVFRPHLVKNKFEVTFVREKLEAATKKTRKIFDVKGHRIEQVVKMTDTEESEEGLERIYHFMSKMGIRSELRHLGAQPGDRIRIAGKTFTMR